MLTQEDIHTCKVIATNSLTKTLRYPASNRSAALALKVSNENSPLPQTTITRQLSSSFQLCRDLSHPGISRAREFSTFDSGAYVTYRYLAPSIWRPLTSLGLLRELPTILPQICEIVDFLHLLGIVHRDIKLDNFLVNEQGRVILIDQDFMCKEGQESDTIICGSPGLQAPEASSALYIDRALDSYSLGASITAALQLQRTNLADLSVSINTLDSLAAFADVLTFPNAEERPRLLLETLVDFKLISSEDLYQIVQRSLRRYCISRYLESYRAGRDSSSATRKLLSAAGGIVGLPKDLRESIITKSRRRPSCMKILAWLCSHPVSRTPHHWRVKCDSNSLSHVHTILFPKATTGNGFNCNDPSSTRYIRELRRTVRRAPSRVIGHLSKMQGSFHTTNDPPLRYLFSMTMYEGFKALGWLPEARCALQEASECHQTTRRRRATLYWLQVQLAISEGDLAGAQRLARRGSQLARTDGFGHRLLEFALARIWIIGIRGRITRALSFIDMIEELARSANDTRALYHAQYMRAVLLYRSGSRERAVTVLKQGHIQLRKSVFTDLLASNQVMMAILAYESGDSKTVLRLTKRVLRSGADVTSQQRASARLAYMNALVRCGRLKEAKSELEEYLSATNRDDLSHGQVIYYWTRGWMSHNRSLPFEAITHYFTALRLAIDVYGANNPKTLGKLYANLAHTYLQIGADNAFDHYISLARENITRANDSVALAEIDALLCLHDFSLNCQQSTQKMAEMALTLSENGSVYMAAECLLLLLCALRDLEGIDELRRILPQGTGSSHIALFTAVETLLIFRERALRNESGRNYSQLQQAFSELMRARLKYCAAFVGLYIVHCAEQDKNTITARAYAKHVASIFGNIGNSRLAERVALMGNSMSKDITYDSLLAKHYALMTDLIDPNTDSNTDLDSLMEETLALTGAECAAIVLERKDGRTYYLPAYVNIRSDMLADIKLMSLSIAKSSSITQESYVIDDALTSELTKSYKSVAAYNILSVASYPFVTRSGRKGALYLAHHSLKSYFQHVDRKFLEALARLIGVVLSVRRETSPTTSVPLVGDNATSRFGLIYGDPLMRNLVDELQVYSQSEIPMLLLGERGVGKELIARMIHESSSRGGTQFRALNCAAIPDEHIESELFGVADSAFTGVKQRAGAFRAADGGTLFLDEIGDLSLVAQAKVLRAIEYQEFTPVGADKVCQTDVRFIFGTNKDIDKMAENGLFRRDLYDRICVFKVKIPPLRERMGDLLPLIGHFCKKCDFTFGVEDAPFSQKAIEALKLHLWPGNVRELENLIRILSIKCKGRRVEITDLPSEILNGSSKGVAGGNAAGDSVEYYRQLLEANRGNISQLARLLGIPITTLHSRLKKLGLI